MEVTRHFTATTTIVHQNKVLLHMHKKMKIWLPVGGHIDRDELPQEAAIREALEESGLEIKLYNPDYSLDISDAQQLIRPSHILLEDINQFHQHIDFIYFATSKSFEVNPRKGETEDLRWFAANELDNLKDIPDNTRKLALEAINLLAK